MKTIVRLSVMSLLVIIPICIWAQPATDKPLQSGNAAMKYWQAIAQLPVMDERQEKMLDDWKSIPLDSEATKLLASCQASIQYLLRAGACRQCNWDLDYDDGPGLLLPHLSKCRTLGRVASLQIRSDFAQGKPAAAVDTLLALFQLARDTGHSPILVSILVGYSIESNAMEAVAPYLQSLDSTQRNRISSRYAALGTMAQVQQAVFTEKNYMHGWLVKHLETAEKNKPGSWRDAWISILVPAKDKHEPYHDRIKQIDSYEKARQLTNDLSPVYDQLLQAFELPIAERAARFEELIQQARKSNPLAEALLPAIHKVASAQNRYQVRQALFRAALAIADKGPDQIKNTADPIGNGPFEYRKLPEGFELISKLRSGDQPVSYTVGK